MSKPLETILAIKQTSKLKILSFFYGKVTLEIVIGTYIKEMVTYESI